MILPILRHKGALWSVWLFLLSCGFWDLDFSAIGAINLFQECTQTKKERRPKRKRSHILRTKRNPAKKSLLKSNIVYKYVFNCFFQCNSLFDTHTIMLSRGVSLFIFSVSFLQRR